MKKICAILCAALLLSGCSKDTGTAQANPVSPTSAEDTSISAEVRLETDMFTDRDKRPEFDTESAVQITLSDSSASASSDTVKIDGTTVTITQEATYILTGALNGTVIVDAPEDAKLQLVLQDAHITGPDCAALYVKEADKVFLTLSGTNSLTNGGSFTAANEANIDGALFSKQDLTLNGDGTLSVTSPAGHGIVCKDDLVFTGGSYSIAASSHGLDANDSIRISDATIEITAGKDGLHAENSDDPTLGFIYISGGTLNLTAEGDGISAGADAQLTGGKYSILSGGGNQNGTKTSSGNYGGFPGGMGRPGRPAPQTQTETDAVSMKGIKAAFMLISGGNYSIDSADDAIHSNGSMTVSGGSYSIATGDDSFHAEDTLTVTDGTIAISKSYEGLEALHIVVSGGDISLIASDDGLNAAGGTDSSGYGGRDGQFGGGMGRLTPAAYKPGRPGGMGSGMGGGGMGGSSGGSILISGGKLYVQSSGDGIDANGTLEITGGDITVCGPTQGDTATLDYDVSATISGGTFIGTGAAGMAQGITGSGQAVIAIRGSEQPAGTKLTLTDTAGNVLITYIPALDFQVILFSTPELKSGEQYILTVGSSTQTVTAN